MKHKTLIILFGAISAAQMVLVTLKLLKLVNLPWLWVLAPGWITLAICVAFVFMTIFVEALTLED